MEKNIFINLNFEPTVTFRWFDPEISINHVELYAELMTNVADNNYPPWLLRLKVLEVINNISLRTSFSTE